MAAPSVVAFAQAADGYSTAPSIARIVFLGDSVTVGFGLENEADERYPAVATRMLSGKHPGIAEINLGESARALCHQDAGYAEIVLNHNPDAVVIQWGVNDQYWGFSVTEFVARYDALVAALRAAKPTMPVVVMTLIADFRRSDHQDTWIGEANVALQGIAARYRCHLADAHRALDHRREYYLDEIHPNRAGAELMAKAVVAALEAPPLLPENANLSFDQGTEVRFLQNVFLPRRQGIEPQWVHVTGINANGMTIESGIPVGIRTAPVYREGVHLIRITDHSSQIVNTSTSAVNWSGMLEFTLEPDGHEGPFQIEIVPAQAVTEK